MPDKRLLLAGVSLPFSVRIPETARLLRDRAPAPDWNCPVCKEDCLELPPVAIPEADWRDFLAEGFENSPYTEYSLITEYFGDALLRRNRLIVHAAALRFRDHAWLICGHPGAGKSTQTKLLQELCPGEFSVICGDRPILDFSADGQILVHPSPWNGKENWHGAAAAPLKGMILLERGPENRLLSLTENEAAIPMYYNLIHSGTEQETILQAARMETTLLNAVPIWSLTSNTIPDSTRMLLESVFSQTSCGECEDGKQV